MEKEAQKATELIRLYKKIFWIFGIFKKDGNYGMAGDYIRPVYRLVRKCYDKITGTGNKYRIN